MKDFSTVVEFSLAGFQDDKVVKQWIEAPGVPIVHTLIDRPAAKLELIAFATRHESEGRVDNVLLSVQVEAWEDCSRPEDAHPQLRKIRSEKLPLATGEVTLPAASRPSCSSTQATEPTLLAPACCGRKTGYTFYLPHGEATEETEALYFLRFPQENQSP